MGDLEGFCFGRERIWGILKNLLVRGELVVLKWVCWVGRIEVCFVGFGFGMYWVGRIKLGC